VDSVSFSFSKPSTARGYHSIAGIPEETLYWMQAIGVTDHENLLHRVGVTRAVFFGRALEVSRATWMMT